MGGDAVEEPAVVADDHDATREAEDGVLQGPQGIDVEVVGRLVEEEHVRAALQHLGQLHAVSLATRELAHLLLLVAALETEAGHIGPGVQFTVPDHDSVEPPAISSNTVVSGASSSRDWST